MLAYASESQYVIVAELRPAHGHTKSTAAEYARHSSDASGNMRRFLELQDTSTVR